MSTEVLPVIHITDVEGAITYYTTTLGFTEDFRWKDYAGVTFGGGARLHLNGFGSEPDRIGKAKRTLWCQMWTKSMPGCSRAALSLNIHSWITRMGCVTFPSSTRMATATHLAQTSQSQILQSTRPQAQ